MCDTNLTGVSLSKVATRAEVERAPAVLHDCEVRVGAAATVKIMPLIESAVGLKALDEIAGSPRALKLQIGENDLVADLGDEVSSDESELAFARSHVVVTSVATGLWPPVGPVSTQYREPELFEESTRRLKRMGSSGAWPSIPVSWRSSIVSSPRPPRKSSRATHRRRRRVGDGVGQRCHRGRGRTYDRRGRRADQSTHIRTGTRHTTEGAP